MKRKKTGVELSGVTDADDPREDVGRCDRGHVKYRKLPKITSGDFGLIPANDTQSASSSKNYPASF